MGLDKSGIFPGTWLHMVLLLNIALKRKLKWTALDNNFCISPKLLRFVFWFNEEILFGKLQQLKMDLPEISEPIYVFLLSGHQIKM